MGWSFKVGRLAGIDIFVHFTFLILLGWIGFAGFASTGSLAVAATSVLLICAVFVIVVLHELGHAMAARYFGIPTRDITLLPIGGVARLERMPEKPVQELVVALAGPAVNVVLAAIFFVLGAFQGGLDETDNAMSFGGSIINQLFLVNVGLVLFNMLPAFPMDGGRVLRALLSMRLGRVRATQLAATVGRGMAILFAVFGLLTMNFMLLFIALFVWIGAGEERAAVQARAGLAGTPVHAVMLRRFVTVDPDDTLGTIANYMRRGYQQDFPVVVGGRIVGLLTGNDLLYAMSEYGTDTRVFQAMRRDFPAVAPGEPVEHGLEILGQGSPVVPVIHAGRLVGLLTAENVTRFMWMRRGERWDAPSDSGHGYAVRA